MNRVIGLNKQIYIYSVDTSAFYNENEKRIYDRLLKAYQYRDKIKVNGGKSKIINTYISGLKTKLYKSFEYNNKVRELRQEHLKEKNVISLFDSFLTRTIEAKQDELTLDLIVVQTYYFQILKDIIKNGFNYNGEEYVYFSSSAGQIRTKKSVFIKKSVFEKHKNTLFCGLTVESINSQGGVNINKYQAYLALSNSASDEWNNFNIHRAIVVNDMETDVFGEVDHINRDTYEITRKKMNIPIEHTDGCGMILPRKNKKIFMCRMPWIKGMLVPFHFDKFIKENPNSSSIVKDIYGKEWDIIKDKIEVILTKSQFKMWKYYKDWDEYKNNFIKYNCKAVKLNEEDVSNDAKLNYQMLQTLTGMTEDELNQIAQSTVNDILNIGSNKETMLRVLGATESNKNKNYFQKALHLYPELLNDEHAKQVIKDKKKSLIKEAKSGKLNVNGKYTFIVPDLYAFCERLFLHKDIPDGLLKNGEVYCDLYEEGKLDILRSPHLYREHGVKMNVKDEKNKKWFITKGVYTSTFDTISKMLQFDNDGDKALVVQDETLVTVAERNMQGIVPLYYEMSKAESQVINADNIYSSLTLAYKANIGEISNNITKIWNNHDVNLDVVKWLTMENNFVIDYAKTLFMPTRPDEVDEIINKYIKTKVPYFFVYAKDKKEINVENINDSVVNKLDNTIPTKRIMLKKVAGKLSYKNLMKNKKIKDDKEIIDAYDKLNRNKKGLISGSNTIKSNECLRIYSEIRKKLLEINQDEDYVVDVLVKYLYKEKCSARKETLWKSFGHVLFRNLEESIKNTIQCESCGKRVEIQSNRKKYCIDCWKEKEREIWRESKKRKRSVQV
ncbi:hypothetical protein COE51_16480 [Bacillus pseudomycoides]|nr:hypothetical protein COE51_16480 [Bacillus pseudomycoides]